LRFASSCGLGSSGTCFLATFGLSFFSLGGSCLATASELHPVSFDYSVIFKADVEID
jgi:hypothetical protein